MNKREGGTIHPRSASRCCVLFVLFRFLSFLSLHPSPPLSLIPSSDKECECLGEQRKPQPHLHLLGTRDRYVNNDRQPTPLSFTAATERLFFLPPLWSGLRRHRVRIPASADDPGGSGWIRGGTLSLPDVTWPQLMRSRQALCSSPASNLTTDGPRDLIPSLNRHGFHFY